MNKYFSSAEQKLCKFQQQLIEFQKVLLLILSNKYYRSSSASVDQFAEDFYANIMKFTTIR